MIQMVPVVTAKKSLIALFGGTFDPIHNGHIRSAEELQALLKAEELRLIPCHRPPHRATPGVSSEHRLAMVTLAVADKEGLSVDGRELAREQLSYTVDTLEQIREECGEQVSLCWVMGTDAFAGLAGWHRWQDLLALAHIVVMTRPGADLPCDGPVAQLLDDNRLASVDELYQRAAGGVLLQTLTAYPISATEVRRALTRGEQPIECLPANVLDYIQQFQLYQC